ncbi:hypothetical protein CEXT_397241 [Caerostris extrusa]|uniref:Uncharacterized protein n=1 Tax=Caerostris extrusa TaxID=172846 RepID=A0AAV4PRE9_CAEEX|nr:hypothetical protein CEXT_397241 [Caerostris extrusa]
MQFLYDTLTNSFLKDKRPHNKPLKYEHNSKKGYVFLNLRQSLSYVDVPGHFSCLFMIASGGTTFINSFKPFTAVEQWAYSCLSKCAVLLYIDLLGLELR